MIPANHQAPYHKSPNSEVVLFHGKVGWVRHIMPNKFDKWSCQFWPDTESLERIRELQAEGVKNVIKKDDDGYNLQLSRPTTVEFRKGVKQGVTPPLITDMDGKPLENLAIGNGTDAVVVCEKYTHRVPNSEKRATAIRWMGLKIENLVPFNVDSDYTNPELAETAKALAEEPKSIW